MGATANEKQAISKHVNRNDLIFMCVVPGDECLKHGRWQITYGTRKDGQCEVFNRLNFHSKEFAEKIRELIAQDWDFAILGERA